MVHVHVHVHVALLQKFSARTHNSVETSAEIVLGMECKFYNLNNVPVYIILFFKL